jgi:putative hydrolase of the HAD superfamily
MCRRKGHSVAASLSTRAIWRSALAETMIRALVVDLDGVLRLLNKEAAKRACRKIGFELDELGDVLWHDEIGRALLRGKTTRDEWWKRVQTKEPRLNRLSHKHVMQSVYDRTSSIDGELLAYLRAVSRTLPVSILTNSDAQSKKETLKELGKDSPFTHVVASSDIGYAKPDPGSFLELLRIVGVEPEECLFFDDKDRNVDVAAGIGIHAHLYIGVQDLKTIVEPFLSDGSH